ncbi:MAG: methyltransferase domain-containing protein [Nanoarchaeota archaeon]|nr:methyltransferase domain-containing protein [Nanoarchaeota archaeon]MBU0977433.1 methyltransferase domain-containing protein [Nanoarchaeota archaeon]
MRDYKFQDYIDLVEKTKDPVLKKFMDDELAVIRGVKDPGNKTFIDLGAGYGRITKELAEIADSLISIEINPGMLPELKRRSEVHENAKVIEGDITNLSEILTREKLVHPILILIQNSLGTIEGSWKKVISEMKRIAAKNRGSIIISFFKSETLGTWGVSDLFSSVSEMTGEPDLEKIDFEKGLFVSKTGYTAKWWGEDEIREVREFFGGRVVNIIDKDNYVVLHFSFE